jgi:uncharacterized protein
LRIVLDTNVLVSGLLSPHGPPGRIVDLLLAGHLGLLVDDRILDEYRRVLKRPRFGFGDDDIARLLAFIAARGEAIAAPPLPVALPDLTDQPFLEVAVAGGAEVLVTGNLRHFPGEAIARLPSSVRIEAPAEFLRSLPSVDL